MNLQWCQQIAEYPPKILRASLARPCPDCGSRPYWQSRVKMRPGKPDWYLVTVSGLNHENRISVSIGCLEEGCLCYRTEFREKPEDAMKLWQEGKLVHRYSKV